MPRLHLTSSFEATWQAVARPWLEQAAATAWRDPRPSAVVVPSRSWGTLIRHRALQDGLTLLGLRFWTPGQARRHLVAHLETKPAVAVREHLHLLLAIVAAEKTDQPTARAVAREPSRLLRTVDALASAGLAADAIPWSEAATIARAFTTRIKKTGWTTVQQLDRQLAAKPPKDTLGRILLVGFDAAHADAWPVLSAITAAAAEADVVLHRPRYKAEKLDQLWIGTWEQRFGTAEPVDGDDPPRPFAPLAETMENPDAVTGPAPAVNLLIGRRPGEQAEAVVAQVVRWLQAADAPRIGIVVPGAGPLAREISARLVALDIAHHDHLGHPAPPAPAATAWKAWLAYQREPRLDALLALDACAAERACAACEDALQQAFRETLADDPRVLAGWLRQRGERGAAGAAALERYPRLPGRAAPTAFAQIVRDVFPQFGLADLATRFEEQFAAIAPLADTEIAASTFIDWLESVTVETPSARDPKTDRPFARVHLTTATDAENQPWTHLVLADLNQGLWPPAYEPPGFLNEDDIARLNRDAVEEGGQGEGHLALRAGRGLVNGPAERRALARRQFYNLVEAPSVALAVAASLTDAEEGRAIGASDFLTHLHFAATGQPLGEAEATAAQVATSASLAKHPLPKPPADAQPVPVDQTRVAHAARNTAGPIGPYLFACDAPPATPLAIACKEWESVLANPQAVWLERVLGVSQAGAWTGDDPRALITGMWVHNWLSRAIAAKHPDGFVAWKPDAVAAGMEAPAERTRRAVEGAYKTASRTLPDAWHAVWARARWIAGELAERLREGATEWPYAATEWSLPRPLEVPLGERTLRLRGRMDFLLSRAETLKSGAELWLFDFKTGSAHPLNSRNLLAKFANGGGGLQLALYARALQQMGASAVDITLLTPSTRAARQLSLTDLAGFDPFLAVLARLQDTGVFGMRGELRPEFGATSSLPLATLRIDPDLLEEQWAATHPDLAGEAAE